MTTLPAADSFERLESNVRAYCRVFPAVFKSARGSVLLAEDGREFIDFFCGAGVMSYGHNNPSLKQALLDYLAQDGICHALDLATHAKRELLESFERLILAPRRLDYKVQFPGPTGTNAVEAALKLARKATGRPNVVYFTNAFHGMTLGSLGVTSNPSKRASAGVPLLHSQMLPFEGFHDGQDSLEVLAAHLEATAGGPDLPAAVILETVQAEGGVNVASFGWLRRLADIVADHGVLLIADEIQVGCGRTGPFFSFEPAGLQPDIICLSKAISGYGLPMALVLLKPELDLWQPGEHNGTFRGNNLAFVTAKAALDYWRDGAFEAGIGERSQQIRGRLEAIAARHAGRGLEVRGRGLIQGLVCREEGTAERCSRAAFERGVVVETAGAHDQVLKLLPALNIEEALLVEGLDRIEAAIEATLAATA